MNGLKKLLNVLLIIIGIILIVFCVDLIINKTANKTYTELGSVDRDAITEMCSIISLFDDRKGNDDVWNTNYNLSDTGCIITKTYGSLKGTSYAVNVDLSGNIFAQKITLPEEYSDIPVYRLSYFAPQTLSLCVPSNDRNYIDLKGDEVYSVKFSKSTVMYNGSGSLEESFVKDTFEKAVETPDAPTAEISEHFQLTEENIALTGLQYRIIDDICDADTLEEVNELITEYVTVREYQLEGNPTLARQQESIELVEGREQFVFYNISELIGHNITYFNKEKTDAIDFYSAYYHVCTGHYQSSTEEYFDHMGNVYVGAVLCEILSDKGLVPNWENKLDNSSNESFSSPYSLIRDYYERACTGIEKKDIDTIKEEYNYGGILNMAKALVQGNAE